MFRFNQQSVLHVRHALCAISFVIALNIPAATATEITRAQCDHDTAGTFMENPPATLATFPGATTLTDDSTLVKTEYGWTIDPYKAGYGHLEKGSGQTYGSSMHVGTTADFPSTPSLTGTLRIPVFLVDWADFDPTINLANNSNPFSGFPNYVKSTPEEVETFLNSSIGPKGYFHESSGGQLDISFDVYGWINSASSTYLKDRAYYLALPSSPERAMAKDVIRAAIGDLNVDLNQYDADSNQVLDGFVICYEGHSNELGGANLSAINGLYTTDAYYFDNASELVENTDINYPKFAGQQVLLGRYNNMPERRPYMADRTPDFMYNGTWTHELGHLLMGYRDYYHEPASLANYALSAGHGTTPLQPAAFEKSLFSGWFPTKPISESGTYTLTNHNIKAPAEYHTTQTYAYKLPIDNDPYRFLVFEYRDFTLPAHGGSWFNEPYSDNPGTQSITGGLLVMEVNLHHYTSEQVRFWNFERNVSRQGHLNGFGGGVHGDILDIEIGNTRVVVNDITTPSESLDFRVTTQTAIAANPPLPKIVSHDSVPTSASMDIGVIFNEPVTPPTAASFAISNGTVASAIRRISPAHYAFTVTPPASGEGVTSVQLLPGQVQDSSGNPNPASNVYERPYDKVNPTILSITRTAASPTSTTSVGFKIACSEPIQPLLPDHFTIVFQGGLTGTPQVNSTQVGNDTFVNVSGYSGIGSILFSAIESNIIDIAGNKMAGGASGSSYQVDTVPPTVTAVTVLSFNKVRCDFSEPVGLSARVPANYTASGTGLGNSTPHPQYVAHPGSYVELTWDPSKMVYGGDITITVDSAVTDLVGNPMGMPNSQTHVGGAVPVSLSSFSLE